MTLRWLGEYIPFLGRFFSADSEEEDNDEESTVPLAPARVAVIGAGVGGCLSAFFLRRRGGEAVEVDVFERGVVGGRTATLSFQGHTSETGAAIIHSSNMYLVNLAKEFGLETKKDVTNITIGIYDGEQYVYRTGWWKLPNILRTLWQYGTSLFKMDSAVHSLVKKFVKIYDIQARGTAFKTVPDLLRAMGGEEMYRTTQVTAEEYLLNDLQLQERLTREMVTAAMYLNYGQGIKVNASTCMVSLAGIQEDSLWSVVGGNRLIPETALKRSGARLRQCEVTSVTRKEKEGEVKYVVETNEGIEREEYDAVIIATPLYEQLIQFRDFPTAIYTNEITSTSYHRTVAEFIDGEINPAFFGLDDNDRNFPLITLTIDSTQSRTPFPFCCVAVDVPSEIPESDIKDFIKPLPEDRSRVWKMFCPRPLTHEEKRQMFKKINAEATVDWLAYPNYSPPESFPPFQLDQGLFYVNGIEKVASAMEMSAVGAMNCALLARDYLITKHDS